MIFKKNISIFVAQLPMCDISREVFGILNNSYTTFCEQISLVGSF